MVFLSGKIYFYLHSFWNHPDYTLARFEDWIPMGKWISIPQLWIQENLLPNWKRVHVSQCKFFYKIFKPLIDSVNHKIDLLLVLSIF